MFPLAAAVTEKQHMLNTNRAAYIMLRLINELIEHEYLHYVKS